MIVKIPDERHFPGWPHANCLARIGESQRATNLFMVHFVEHSDDCFLKDESSRTYNECNLKNPYTKLGRLLYE